MKLIVNLWIFCYIHVQSCYAVVCNFYDMVLNLYAMLWDLDANLVWKVNCSCNKWTQVIAEEFNEFRFFPSIISSTSSPLKRDCDMWTICMCFYNGNVNTLRLSEISTDYNPRYINICYGMLNMFYDMYRRYHAKVVWWIM